MKKIKILFVSFLIGLSSLTQSQATWNPFKMFGRDTSNAFIKNLEQEAGTNLKQVVDATGKTFTRLEDEVQNTIGETQITINKAQTTLDETQIAINKVQDAAHEVKSSFSKAGKAFNAAEATALKIDKVADKAETLITLLTILTGVLIFKIVFPYILSMFSQLKKKRKIRKDGIAMPEKKKRT